MQAGSDLWESYNHIQRSATDSQFASFDSKMVQALQDDMKLVCHVFTKGQDLHGKVQGYGRFPFNGARLADGSETLEAHQKRLARKLKEQQDARKLRAEVHAKAAEQRQSMPNASDTNAIDQATLASSSAATSAQQGVSAQRQGSVNQLPPVVSRREAPAAMQQAATQAWFMPEQPVASTSQPPGTYAARSSRSSHVSSAVPQTSEQRQQLWPASSQSRYDRQESRSSTARSSATARAMNSPARLIEIRDQ